MKRAAVLLLAALLCIISSGVSVSPVLAQEDGEGDTVKMKIVAQNPSDEEKLIVIKEDIPEEIVDKDDVKNVHPDLELIYDNETGTYFVVCKEKEIVYKGETQRTRALVLAPKQTRIFIVELKNVWKIRDEEFESYATRLASAREALADSSEYAEQSERLGGEAQKRLDEIVDFQGDESKTRKEQIVQFRRNKERMKQILADIETLESYTVQMTQKDKDIPGKEIKPSSSMLWLAIFIILTFLGILSAVFYFVWHKRSKSFEDSLGAEDTAFKDGKQEEE
jgi:hypothetical protein